MLRFINGRSYFQKSERVGDKVVTRYYGGGQTAIDLAEVSRVWRERRTLQRLEDLDKRTANQRPRSTDRPGGESLGTRLTQLWSRRGITYTSGASGENDDDA